MFGQTINTRNHTKTSNKLTPQTFNSIGGRKQISSNIQNETILYSRAQQDFTPPSFEGHEENLSAASSQLAVGVQQIMLEMVNEDIDLINNQNGVLSNNT